MPSAKAASKATKEKRNSMGRAREFLVILLSFTSTCEASWFTINGDTTYEFPLCQRLGFYHATDYYAFLVLCGLAEWTKMKGGGGSKSLQIHTQRWTDLISEYDLDASRFHLTQTRIDLEAKIQGVQVMIRDYVIKLFKYQKR